MVVGVQRPLTTSGRRVELAPVGAADAVGEDGAALTFHPGHAELRVDSSAPFASPSL